MKKFIFLALVLIIFSVGFSSKVDPLLLDEFKTSSGVHLLSVPQHEFIVLYNGQIPSGNIIHKYRNFNAVLMRGTLSDIYTLSRDPNVIYIYSINHKFHVDLNLTVNNTNSPIGDYPYLFSKYNGSNVKIAVLDTGANWSISSLNQSNRLLNISFVGNTAPGDHGTFVISELISSNKSYPGIVPGSKIMDVKVIDKVGTLDQLLAGLDYALSEHPNIISMSLGMDAVGFGSRSEYLDLLFNSIFGNNFNVVFVVAAGNNGTSGYYTISQPGSSRYAITVGAVDRNSHVESFSSRGPLESNRIKPDVCATGDIYGFGVDGKLEPMLGTSMATPLVAGASAILYQAGITDPIKIKFILMETAKPLDSPWKCGAGVINVSKAVSITNGTYFIISTKYGFDNYLGYVSGNASFNLIFENDGSKNDVISYNVTLYNGTVVYSGNVTVPKNGGTNLTNVKFSIPNLPNNESYGYIITNNSLEIPFSWANSRIVDPSEMFKPITGSNYYTLNYTKFPGGDEIFEVLKNTSSGFKFFKIIGKGFVDYQGWSTNDTSDVFLVRPLYSIQNINYIIYNLLPWNITVYGLDCNADNKNSVYEVNHGAIMIKSDDFSVSIKNATMNYTGLPLNSTVLYAVTHGVVFANYKLGGDGDYILVLPTNTNYTVKVTSSENGLEYCILVNSTMIPALSKKEFNDYNVLLVTPYNFTSMGLLKSINMNTFGGLNPSASPVQGKVWDATISFNLGNNYTGTANMYVIVPGVKGLVSSNSYVVVKRSISLTHGVGSKNIHIYIPSYVNSVLICYNNLSFDQTNYCKQIPTVSSGGGGFTSSDSNWINSLVLEVSKIIKLFTG